MSNDPEGSLRDFDDGESAKRVLEFIESLAKSKNTRAFIVGGAVRDHLYSTCHRDNSLLGAVSGKASGTDALRDLDIVIEGDAREFATSANEILRGSLQIFDRFLTAKITHPVAFPGIKEVDFASTRTELYERPGALPTVHLSSLADDLRRRDFSVNALAVPLANASALIKLDTQMSVDTIVDQFGGVEDLKLKKIRVLHERSFIDDPTRLFRAIRYAVRLSFDYEAQTERLFQESVIAQALRSVSAARIYTEVRKILREAKSTEMLLACVQKSLFDNWAPRAALSNAEFVDLIEQLSPDAGGPELLKLICQRDPTAQPQTWGLSLSKKAVSELTGKA